MDPGLIFAAATGLLAGIVHVLIGPDHLAAVAPLSVNQRQRTWLTGLWWGIGHTSGVWAIGLIVFIWREVLPIETLSQWSERLVGFVLIALGLWTFRKALNSRLHFHEHEHDGDRHAHFHLHQKNPAQPHKSQHSHAHAPFGIGILHGLAGTSHLFGILPALAFPDTVTAVGYVVGFGVGAIVAMSAFSWALGQLAQRLIDRSAQALQWLQYGFSSLAIGVGVAWILFI